MNSSHPGFWEVKSCTPGGRGAYLLMGSFTTTMASTICSSLGELTVTPCDSGIAWRNDGQF